MVQKKYHHGDLRLALVKAARVILERDGLAALTLRACAREAGVSHAAPMHHFRSLAELQSAIASSGFGDFVAFLESESGQESKPGARLLAMGHAYVRFSALHPALYRLMFGVEKSHVMSQELLAAMSAAWLQLFGAVTAAAGHEDAEQKALFVWSFVHGHSMLRASQFVPPSVDLDDHLQGALALLARGINAEGV